MSALTYLHVGVCVRKRVGGLKLEDLPGMEALQVPGVILNNTLLFKDFTQFCVSLVDGIYLSSAASGDETRIRIFFSSSLFWRGEKRGCAPWGGGGLILNGIFL